MRTLTLSALLAAGVLAAGGCGSSDRHAGALGSASNPIHAVSAADVESNPPPGSARKPSYQRIVDAQSSKPRSRFTPCNLVTPAQARSILGAAIQAPVEAPQGPTCIYRTRHGAGYVTVAVQRLDMGRLKRQLQQRRPVHTGGRSGWCGHYGQQMLYLPVSGGRVLTIAGSCSLATKFAARAVPRLG